MIASSHHSSRARVILAKAPCFVDDAVHVIVRGLLEIDRGS